uniref:Integrase zinc-binding domain-containing protein n=1 Tax=Cajanus cajan TaxID=3821 RepID=A0A151SGC3_CAJCA|nr:hypothetical protein KK1_024409 [Cajanus cajan]
MACTNHEGITDLDPRSDAHDERPSPVDELDNLQIGELPGQTTKISIQLNPELRQQLEAEILRNADFFAWSSTDMLGIDADFICHKLAIHKEAKPVTQRKRKVGGERQEAIVVETQKLLNAGFIREVRYTTWLANVVLVKKNSGKWRMCVDYTDLNKACPKDSYPLPSIDRLDASDPTSRAPIKQILRKLELAGRMIAWAPKGTGNTEPLSKKLYTRPNVSNNEDPGWMTDIWGYLRERTLPEDKNEAWRIRMRSAKFVIIENELFKCGISSPLLKCLTTSQAAYVIREIHQGICGMHSGARSMAARVLRAGYYWPTLKSDCQNHIQKCKECQQFGNAHRQPPETLHHMMIAWPFSQFRISQALVTDNGQWPDQLPSILWAYHCTPQSITQETPYRLTYGTNAMIPVEVCETSHRRQAFNSKQNAQELAADLDIVDELRDVAQIHKKACKICASRRYNTRVKPRSFQVGDLVWRLLGEARKDTLDGKLAPTWGGPFRVTEDLENGAYRLEELNGKPIPRTWNAMHLKFDFS